MHMWRLRMIAAAALLLAVSGCSNPLIGKWKLETGPASANCSGGWGGEEKVVKIAFTEKTVTVTFATGSTDPRYEKPYHSMTYKVGGYDRSSDGYSVQYDAVGIGILVEKTFKTESGAIEVDGCRYVPDNRSLRSTTRAGQLWPVGASAAVKIAVFIKRATFAP
jgi:hypothetical protein